MTTTTTTTTTREQLARERRIAALERELRLALRILNPEVAALHVRASGPAPAWTDFESVYLNAAALPQDVRRLSDLATWIGAALHELGHTILSPRRDSELWKRLEALARTLAPSAFTLHNMLEDQRQERAIISRFAPMRGYLAALALRLIIEEGEPRSAWPLITGRVWVAREARAQVRAAWIAQHGHQSAAAIAQIVGEYQTLSDPAESQSERAAELVLELSRVLQEANEQAPEIRCGGSSNLGGESVPMPESDAPTAASEEEEIEAEEESGGSGGSESGEEEAEEESGGSGGSESDESGEEETESDGGGSGGSESDESGEEEAEEETESDGGGSGGSGGSESAKSQEPSEEEISESLSEALSDILSAEDVARELEDYREALESAKSQEPGRESCDRIGGERYGSPSNEALSVRSQLVDTLARLSAAAEPGWLRGESSGRVNAVKLSDPLSDPASLFDRFDPGALEDVSTSVVVLVDQSGSMGHLEAELSEAIWAMSHAAARSEVELTILGFSTGEPVTLRGSEDGAPSERVRIVGTGGGTEPSGALRFAWRRFQETESAHKVLITLSDGEWHTPYSQSVSNESLIQAMASDGVITAAMLLEYEAWRDRRRESDPKSDERQAHGAALFVSSESIADLPLLFGEIVSAAMERGLARHML